MLNHLKWNTSQLPCPMIAIIRIAMWFLWSINSNHQKSLFQDFFNRRSTDRVDSCRINRFKTLTNFEWRMIDFLIWILIRKFNGIAPSRTLSRKFMVPVFIALRLCKCYITNKLTWLKSSDGTAFCFKSLTSDSSYSNISCPTSLLQPIGWATGDRMWHANVSSEP